MKLIWTRFAVTSLHDIFVYYAEMASPSTASKIRVGIVSEVNKLAKFPFAGQIEDLLLPLKQQHRYLLKGHYKIIYRIVEDEIVITDVVDTRQNPNKIKRHSK